MYLIPDGSDECDRGQVGVELLIVFVAVVVVAAIAATTMINTAVSLQTQAQATGQESVDGLTDRLQITAASGEVADDGTVDAVTLRVDPAPGAGPIDLSALGVRTVGDGYDGTAAVEVWGDDGTVVDEDGEFGYVHLYGADGLPPGERLEPGDEVTVRVTTAAGATTTYTLRVPPTLAGESVVEL